MSPIGVRIPCRYPRCRCTAKNEHKDGDVSCKTGGKCEVPKLLEHYGEFVQEAIKEGTLDYTILPSRRSRMRKNCRKQTNLFAS